MSDQLSKLKSYAPKILRIALIIEMIVLLGSAIAIRRDYQDTWILEGLEIPFVLFMMTYLIYGFTENNLKWIILLAFTCRSVIVLLPNLKYPWFQGVWIDQNRHYKLFQDTYDIGYVPDGRHYSGTPFIHLLFAIYQGTTGVSALYIFKYMPIVCWLVYPLAVYLITKCSISENSSILKYAVFISSIPVTSATSYVVTGSLFGILLVFLVLSQFAKVFQTNNRNHWIIAVIYSFVLVAAHSYSSLILAIGSLITYLIFKVARAANVFKIARAKAHGLNINLLMFLFVLNIGWLAFIAIRLFSSMAQIMGVFLEAIIGTAPSDLPTTGIRPAYFSLSLIDALRVLLVYHGGTIFVLFLTLLGVIIVIKKFQGSKSLMFLALYFVSVWLFFFIQLLLPAARAGLVEYGRIFIHTLVLSPIFIGILLYYLHKKTRHITPSLFITLALMGLVTIQLYKCQPLIPNSESGEPRVYVGTVNSPYQRFMIKHAEKYIDEGTISVDVVTSSQIVGLTDYDFSHSNSLRYYLFENELDLDIVERESDYFLIHFPGKSGVLSIKAQTSLRNLILKAVYNSSIIYTNGESHILAKPFMSFTTP